MAAQAPACSLLTSTCMTGIELPAHACMHAGFCKQQLWPLFHYLLPLSPTSTGRFNPELWQAYVKANKVPPLPFGSQNKPDPVVSRLVE